MKYDVAMTLTNLIVQPTPARKDAGGWQPLRRQGGTSRTGQLADAPSLVHDLISGKERRPLPVAPHLSPTSGLLDGRAVIDREGIQTVVG
jgi:hypothetical protein